MAKRRAVRAIVISNARLLVMERNKFGRHYYTLVGGGIDHGEDPLQTLHREVEEECSMKIANPRLVFIDHAGDPYGDQLIYLCDYIEGDPVLHPDSEEYKINQLGQNTHKPVWLAISKLPHVPFKSDQLKERLLRALENGFPQQAIEFDSTGSKV